MSFKKKLENFWYYYKVPVIIVIIVAAAGIFLISEMSKSVPSDLKISLISEGTLSDETINFNEALPNVIQDIDNDGGANITISRIYINKTMKTEDLDVMKNTLESQLANKGATLFIVDQSNYDNLIKKDAFCPLNELMDLSDYGDRVIYRGEVPIALHLSGSKVLADMKFENDDLYALVLFRRPGEENDPVRVKEYENATLVLKELMKQS